MGYACPVCTDPQADATHLANHLAFTALVRGGDHEVWLDEHVPEWDSMNEETLGAALTELADDTDYPQVFEDTTEQGHSHDRQHDHETAGLSDAMRSEAESALAEEEFEAPDEVLAEARELTRKRREQRESEQSEDSRNASGDDTQQGGSDTSDAEQNGGESDSESE